MDEEIIRKAYREGEEAVIRLVNEMYAFLSAQIVQLQNENRILTNRLIELEARLNKNSNNSSKPPSSDGYNKPKTKNNREKTNRPTGGQSGHKGATLEKVANPDEVIDINIFSCECGSDLSNVEGNTKSRQVFELPKIKMKVTEYVTHEKVCPICGKVHRTEFPVTVTQPTQYGDNMKAVVNYFTNYQLLPLARTAEAIRDITGHSISEGTIVNAGNSLYDSLEEVSEIIKNQIKDSNVIHFDETGMRCDGKTKWLYVASTEKLTHYAMRDGRSIQAAKDIGILPEFNGTAVHDHLKLYYSFMDCTHSECNSHNLRYLRDAHENYNQEWAKDMIELLVEIKRRVDILKTNGCCFMESAEIEIWKNKYHDILEAGISEEAQKTTTVIAGKKGKPQKSKPLLLLLKLQQYDIETLAFMYDFDVPFDNNLAERDLRMQKLRQKISGCFRSDDNAKMFCRIRGYISTAKKNGQTAMQAITSALKGTPFTPQTK